MPAARYWRAVGLQSVGGAALALSALHLYMGGVRVDASATITSTFAPESGLLSLLQDENTATVVRWLNVSAPSFAVVWDFGAGNAQDVGSLRLGSGALYAEFLDSITMQFSSDGVVWVGGGWVRGFAWPGENTMQSAPLDGDFYYPQVALLLHCDGANGSTVFTDSSASPRSVLRSGDVKISTAQSLLGGACAEFDGSGDFLTLTDIPNLGTSEFCLEISVRVPSLPSSGTVRMIMKSRGNFNFEIREDGGVGLYLFSGALYAYGGGIAANTRCDISLVRRGGSFYGYINGVQVFSLASAVSFGGAVLDLGYDIDATERAFLGWMDEIRLTIGTPRYSGAYTPRSSPSTHSMFGAVSGASTVLFPAPDRARIAASSYVPLHSTLSAPRLLLARDMEFGGNGTVYGTVDRKGTPANVPLRRRVRLHSDASGNMVRETWSDAVTGEFAFHGIDPTQAYTTIAYDYEHNFRAVAADNLTPEVQP